MEIDRDRARRAFAAYVSAYDPDNERIALKVTHTYRVAALAERIANGIGLGAADVDLAWLVGLLHDIGRFEQVRRFDTFRDADSVSHAALGVSVLFDEGRIRDFLDEDPQVDGLVRQAVALHSGYRLPEGLDGRTRMFCDILRDADKVDIIRTVSASTPQTILGCDERGLARSRVSAAARRAFAERRCMLRAERTGPADILVGFACFAFELAYPESRRAMREQGYLAGLLEHPFGIGCPYELPETAAAMTSMARDLDRWLDTEAS